MISISHHGSQAYVLLFQLILARQLQFHLSTLNFYFQPSIDRLICSLIQVLTPFHILLEHTKNKGRNTYKGFLPFFEKPGAITTTPHTVIEGEKNNSFGQATFAFPTFAFLKS